MSVLQQPLGPILVSIALFHRALGAMLATQNAWVDALGKSGAAEALCDELDAQDGNRAPDGSRTAPPLSNGTSLRTARFRYTPELDAHLDETHMDLPAQPPHP